MSKTVIIDERNWTIACQDSLAWSQARRTQRHRRFPVPLFVLLCALGIVAIIAGLSLLVMKEASWT